MLPILSTSNALRASSPREPYQFSVNQINEVYLKKPSPTALKSN
jgi:hypothetical protein